MRLGTEPTGMEAEGHQGCSVDKQRGGQPMGEAGPREESPEGLRRRKALGAIPRLSQDNSPACWSRGRKRIAFGEQCGLKSGLRNSSGGSLGCRPTMRMWDSILRACWCSMQNPVGRVTQRKKEEAMLVGGDLKLLPASSPRRC